MADDMLVMGILWYAVFVASATLHEAAHAFTSWKLGDSTAWEGGQVSLNPAAHIKREPFGMVVIPWVTYAASGWMMGWASAPYNAQWARFYPNRAAAMSLAGPAANLALALIGVILIHAGLLSGFFVAPDRVAFSQVVHANSDGLSQGIAFLVSILFSLNLGLFVFNMIPIAPLDGQAWMNLVLPNHLRDRYQLLMMHPSLRFMGIFLAWILMDWIYSPLYFKAIDLIYIFYGVSYE